MKLSGNWTSFYRYHEDEVSRHKVAMVELANNQHEVKGEDEAGSTIYMLLTHDTMNNTLTGTWKEHTSLQGQYKGAVFHGAVQFILNANSTEAKGKWVGFNNDKDRVNTGEWILKR